MAGHYVIYAVKADVIPPQGIIDILAAGIGCSTEDVSVVGLVECDYPASQVKLKVELV